MSKESTKRSKTSASGGKKAAREPKRGPRPFRVSLFPNGTLSLHTIRLLSTFAHPPYGERLPLPGMQHAPRNEAGVLVLFGMLAERLGFIVEAVGQRFPDCVAKQAVDAERRAWRRLLIEFEYRSSNFERHGHNPNGCDLIVCWEHDWPRCPLDVLELRWAVRALAARDSSESEVPSAE